jgi:hypothetical protein
MVAHQLAAAGGEDRRTADQTRSLLLAALGRESSDEAALRKHAVQDRGTTNTSWIGEAQTGADFGDEGGMRGQGVGIIDWKGGSLELRKPQER